VTLPDNTQLLFDFTDPATVNDWAPIDDRVMGGVSRSALRHDPRGHATFEGTVSLEHNGGFASVRSNPAARGRPGATACHIDVRGEPKQFKLSLLTDDGFDSVNYQASFMPPGTDWQTLSLPLAAFRASWRGREVPGAPPLDPARIRQVGLMIAGETSRALRTGHRADQHGLMRTRKAVLRPDLSSLHRGKHGSIAGLTLPCWWPQAGPRRTRRRDRRLAGLPRGHAAVMSDLTHWGRGAGKSEPMPTGQEKSTWRCHQVLVSSTKFGRRDWTRTNDPHHVKVVL
jgi:NADH dehydrogenase [ubiquinone] 1 alpha subcomplex assembly factor 1